MTAAPRRFASPTAATPAARPRLFAPATATALLLRFLADGGISRARTEEVVVAEVVWCHSLTQDLFANMALLSLLRQVPLAERAGTRPSRLMV